MCQGMRYLPRAVKEPYMLGKAPYIWGKVPYVVTFHAEGFRVYIQVLVSQGKHFMTYVRV